MAGLIGLERTGSGLSDAGHSTGRRDTVRGPASEREPGSDTPVSATAAMERREARMVDGVAMDASQAGVPGASGTALGSRRWRCFRRYHHAGPHSLPPGVIQPNLSAIRETHHPTTTSREAAERIIRDNLDNGEAHAGNPPMGSPKRIREAGSLLFRGSQVNC